MGVNPAQLMQMSRLNGIKNFLADQQTGDTIAATASKYAKPMVKSVTAGGNLSYDYKPHYTGGMRESGNPNVSLPPPSGYLGSGTPGVDYDHSIVGGDWSPWPVPRSGDNTRGAGTPLEPTASGSVEPGINYGINPSWDGMMAWGLHGGPRGPVTGFGTTAPSGTYGPGGGPTAVPTYWGPSDQGQYGGPGGSGGTNQPITHSASGLPVGQSPGISGGSHGGGAGMQPDHLGYGQSANSRANSMIMDSQAYGGAPNLSQPDQIGYMGEVTDEQDAAWRAADAAAYANQQSLTPQQAYQNELNTAWQWHNAANPSANMTAPAGWTPSPNASLENFIRSQRSKGVTYNSVPGWGGPSSGGGG